MTKKIVSRPQEPLPRIHCCSKMDYVIQDERIPLKYSPVIRSYFLPFITMKGVVHPITHCPWCGKELPKSLRKEFFEILEQEYGIEANVDILKNQNIPEEFKSDAWWKKRGL